jgi:hypothetical protein
VTLERRTPLKRTGFASKQRLGNDAQPTRRGKPLKAMSNKRKRLLPIRAEVRIKVFERDGYRCQLAHRIVDVPELGPCFGPLTPHHLKKEGQGGSYSESNLLSLCSSHNEWVEREPDVARSLGLVIKSWEDEA